MNKILGLLVISLMAFLPLAFADDQSTGNNATIDITPCKICPAVCGKMDFECQCKDAKDVKFCIIEKQCKYELTEPKEIQKCICEQLPETKGCDVFTTTTTTATTTSTEGTTTTTIPEQTTTTTERHHGSWPKDSIYYKAPTTTTTTTTEKKIDGYTRSTWVDKISWYVENSTPYQECLRWIAKWN